MKRGRPCETGNFAGRPREPVARPEVALPRPELWTSVHQDGAVDRRPAGRRGRNPGGFASAEALSEEDHAPHPQAKPCGECADGRRAGAHDPEAGWGTKRQSTTEIYATVALALVKCRSFLMLKLMMARTAWERVRSRAQQSWLRLKSEVFMVRDQ